MKVTKKQIEEWVGTMFTGYTGRVKYRWDYCVFIFYGARKYEYIEFHLEKEWIASHFNCEVEDLEIVD